MGGRPVIVAVVQARSSSSRLPGKVLRPILGLPMLVRQLQRVALATRVDRIVVATSEDPLDDAVAAAAITVPGVTVHRGSLDDVLGRVCAAAEHAGARHVVRLTGDCPMVDPVLIDRVVGAHLDSGADYTSNTWPRTFPDGLDVEVLRFEVLAAARAEARLPSEREHVTPFVHRHPERFRLHGVTHATDLSHLRWVVDHEVDLRVVAAVFERLHPLDPAFGMDAVLRLLEEQPELFAQNAGIDPDEGWRRSLRADAEFDPDPRHADE
jgi:spore coat polysaccharide biosynthesis protein SpsF